MTVKHQPLITRHGTECICGVFCGSKPDWWLSHARDQVTLHPELGTSEFNFTASTPLSRSLQRVVTQAGESFAHVRKTVGRAFNQIKEPFMGYNALMEQGRRLASERDDLIASGVDPARLLIPADPRCFHRRLMVVSEGPDKYTECLDCKVKFAGEYTPDA